MKLSQLLIIAAFLGQDVDAVQLEHHHKHKHHPKHHHHHKNIGVRFIQTMKEEEAADKETAGMTEPEVPEVLDKAKTGELGKVDTPEEAKELAKSIKEREEAPMILPKELSEDEQRDADAKMFKKLAVEGDREGRKKDQKKVAKEVAAEEKAQKEKEEKAKADMDPPPPKSAKLQKLKAKKAEADAAVAEDKKDETAESVEQDEIDKKDRQEAAALAEDKKALGEYKNKQKAKDEEATKKIEAAEGPKPLVADPTAAKLAEANANIAKMVAADDKEEEIKQAEKELREQEVKPDNVGQAASAAGEAKFDDAKVEAAAAQEGIDAAKGNEGKKKAAEKQISKEVAKEGVRKDSKIIPGYSKGEHWTVNMPEHIQAGGSLMQLNDSDSDSDSD